LRAKFTNDSNFFVRGVGRGNGVLEHSLEIAEVLRGEKMTTGSRFAHILEKGSGKFTSNNQTWKMFNRFWHNWAPTIQRPFTDRDNY